MIWLRCSIIAKAILIALAALTTATGVATLARLVHAGSPVLPVRIVKPPDMVKFLLDVTGLAAQVTVHDDDPGFPGG